ncbi:MAG: glycosyltransferase family 4 protein [Chitinophagales bacterium]
MSITQQSKKVAILSQYPGDISPGQRFRYQQYLSFLAKQGIICHEYPFLDMSTTSILYKKGHTLHKILGVLWGFIRRTMLLFRLVRYDCVFIYREASPIGPPFFEWFIAKILGKKIILDFDDAIWMNKTVSQNPLVAWLRNHQKVAKICKWAWKVTCSNAFLANFAQQLNQQVIQIPTTIDTENYHFPVKQHRQKEHTIIGWTGTITTMIYLDALFPILEKVAEKYPIKFLIISNQAPKIARPFIEFQQWKAATEIADLRQFDIGIMPLSNTEWEKGKGGFKALQYMALGIPPVVSPVGVNKDIVQDNLNGFHATTPEEWIDKLSRLIESVDLRKKIGASGRKTVVEHYSVLSQQDRYLALFT